ncbi:MAG: serpin family protein [Lachnospiraceae bacterium]|nr:serpin family protein [Lachnospiraceae bacterium]
MKRFIKTTAALITAGSILIGMSGCTSSVKNVKAADLMDGVTAREVTVETDANAYSPELTDFAVRLFNACNENSKDNENTLISPLSVLLALSMTANGAQGETLEQMENVLGLPVSKLNEFAYAYSKVLKGRPDSSGTLSLANSIWFTSDPGFHVNNDFLQVNADYYNASVYSAPFDDSTIKDINNWVNKKTDGMIPSILEEIPESAVMYLVNALAFDAEWTEAYFDYQVKENIYTTADGTQKKVPFLNRKEDTYIEDDNAIGFIKYYKGGKYAFAALLPNEGTTPADYLRSIDGAHLRNMLVSAQKWEVITSLPKFETKYSMEMADVLKAMGMPRAFDENRADFSKLGRSDGWNIFISKVFHKTFIAVDEKGTKAGAATIVQTENGGSSQPIEKPKPKEVYLTRPFVYMLIDCETNVPFFIGIMNDPEK